MPRGWPLTTSTCSHPFWSRRSTSLRHGLTLWRGSDRLGCFDAVLAATAALQGASALVSADSAFAEVTGLKHVVPDAAGIEGLLNSRR